MQPAECLSALCFAAVQAVAGATLVIDCDMMCPAHNRKHGCQLTMPMRFYSLVTSAQRGSSVAAMLG